MLFIRLVNISQLVGSMEDGIPKGKRLVGKVTHFFGNISVAAIELSETLAVGSTVSFEGATTNFEQRIDSMQIHNKAVKEAKAGEVVGIKVRERVREGDHVYIAG
jgi:translation elongation factor EF-1alpha